MSQENNNFENQQAPQAAPAAPAAPALPVLRPDEPAKVKIIAGFSMLCPALFWLHWVAGGNSEFGKFYCNQALVALIAGVVFGCLSFLIIGIPLLCVLYVFEIIGAIKAFTGNAWQMPLLGKIKIIK